MPDAASPQRIDRGTVLALAAMSIGVFVIANDFTAMSVALTSMERDLDSELSTIQWVINAYALVFGVLIVTGGRLADMFGRRRAFFVGSAIFAAFSVLGGLASDSTWLIGCRAGMGIGGAMMWPAVLGMTYAALPESRAGLAGALVLGAAGLGNAAGPLLGGFLTDVLSWRWILFVNLPIAAIACLVIWLTVHQREPATRERFDYAGVVTLSTGLVALLLALDESEDFGWADPRIIGLLAVSGVLLAAFARVERRAGARALVPRDVVSNRDFSAACLTVLLLSAVFFVAVLYLPQYMQKLLGYSPLEAGAGLLPMLALFAAVSFVSGPLYDRLGAKVVVSAGAGCLAAGMFVVTLAAPDSGYGALVPGMVVLGIGVGLFYSSVTTAAVTSLDPSRTSLAGGIVYMFQVAGGAVGIGLTTAVFSAASASGLADGIRRLGVQVTEAQQDAVQDILAGTEPARRALAQFSPEIAVRLQSLVRDAFVAGLDTAFRVDAALALGGFLVALALVGGRLGARR